MREVQDRKRAQVLVRYRSLVVVVHGLCFKADNLFLPCLRSSFITPAKTIRQGIGAGAAGHSVKALQIALVEVLLGGSPNGDGKIEGYEVSAKFARPRVTSNGEEYCRNYRRLSTFSELQWVNLNPPEQNHSKKWKNLPMLCNMGYEVFAFTTTLVNDLESNEINRTTCDEAVGRATGHTRSKLLCRTEVWSCDPCLRNAPLMRSFHEYDRMSLTSLPE